MRLIETSAINFTRLGAVYDSKLKQDQCIFSDDSNDVKFTNKFSMTIKNQHKIF